MTAPLLAVEDVGLRFGPVRVLDGVTFSVGPGELVGLVGANGAGKTSVLNCISGVVRPSRGRICYRGTDLAGAGPTARARMGLARTLQGLGVVDALDVRANLLLGPADPRRLGAVAQSLGLTDQLDVPARRLAAGARKRLELGRALVANPAVLLLDEPFAGAGGDDIEVMVRAIAAARARGVAAVVVDHDLDTVAGLVDRVVTLGDGRVRTDPPATFRRRDHLGGGFYAECAFNAAKSASASVGVEPAEEGPAPAPASA